jgi:hypothetical protein
MKKQKVYIASPYSIGDKEENVRVQMECGLQLLDLGFTPYVPLVTHYMELISPRDYNVWLDNCLEWLVVCDIVLRLPGESIGADIEVAYAEQHKIPVVYSIEELKKLSI